ncbi:hypothetical protein TrST_g6883 [Triparma strigata]|uniref:Pentatricopeptide repeat-containing protein n=1 Tax=Triparma strigata TaxID=1606541 RepID=A0A9W7EMI0_9STRA|nr:hypothetical protein TrST_g6883 [Triparma strigata]
MFRLTSSLLGRRSGSRALAPKPRKTKKKTRKPRPTVKGKHSEPMSIRRKGKDYIDSATMERYKTLGPIATLPAPSDMELLAMRDAEDGDSEAFDDMVSVLMYGEPVELTENHRRRYMMMLESNAAITLALPPQEDPLRIDSGSTTSTALATTFDSTLPSDSSLSPHHVNLLLASQTAYKEDPSDSTLASLHSTITSVLNSHSSRSSRSSRSSDSETAPTPLSLISLLTPHLSLPLSLLLSPPVTSTISYLSRKNPSAPSQILPLLSTLDIASNLTTLVHNLPYSSSSSSALINTFESSLRTIFTNKTTLTPSQRSTILTAASTFGHSLLAKSRSNLPYVSTSILQNPLLSSLYPSGLAPPEIISLDLHSSALSGTPEHSLNLLKLHPTPSPLDFSNAFKSYSLSLKWDRHLIKTDVKIISYYCRLLHSMILLFQSSNSRHETLKVLPSLLNCVGVMGDFSTCKSIIQSLEIQYRDLANEELNGDINILPDNIPIGPGVIEWNEDMYISVINSLRYTPLINSLYGMLSEAVVYDNRLVKKERDRGPKGINMTSVPGMKDIEVGIASLGWDQFSDGRRPNRGKLKRERFRGVEVVDEEYGTGRLGISMGWELDEVYGRERFERIQEAEKDLGVEKEWEEWDVEEEEEREFGLMGIEEGGDRFLEEFNLSMEEVKRIAGEEWEGEDEVKSLGSEFLKSLPPGLPPALPLSSSSSPLQPSSSISPSPSPPSISTSLITSTITSSLSHLKKTHDSSLINVPLLTLSNTIRLPDLEQDKLWTTRIKKMKDLISLARKEGKLTTSILNSGLSVICASLRLRTAVEFYENEYGDFKRDGRSCRSILVMFLKAKRLEEALEWKERIEREGGEVDVVGYGAFVRALTSKGHIISALKMVKECHTVTGKIPYEGMGGIKSLRRECVKEGWLWDGKVTFKGLGDEKDGKKDGKGKYSFSDVGRGFSEEESVVNEVLEMIKVDPKEFVRRGQGREKGKRHGKKDWRRMEWTIRDSKK